VKVKRISNGLTYIDNVLATLGDPEKAVKIGKEYNVFLCLSSSPIDGM
jgi:hypothetical protein